MLIGVTIGTLQIHLAVQNGLTMMLIQHIQQAVKLLTMKQEILLKHKQTIQEVRL